PDLLVTVALGNGFILTSMLWGAFVAKLIDRRLKTASFYLLLCAAFTFFGIIHSAIPEGNMYLPWLLPDSARRIPYQFTAGYVVRRGFERQCRTLAVHREGRSFRWNQRRAYRDIQEAWCRTMSGPSGANTKGHRGPPPRSSALHNPSVHGNGRPANQTRPPSGSASEPARGYPHHFRYFLE